MLSSPRPTLQPVQQPTQQPVALPQQHQQPPVQQNKQIPVEAAEKKDTKLVEAKVETPLLEEELLSEKQLAVDAIAEGDSTDTNVSDDPNGDGKANGGGKDDEAPFSMKFRAQSRGDMEELMCIKTAVIGQTISIWKGSKKIEVTIKGLNKKVGSVIIENPDETLEILSADKFLEAFGKEALETNEKVTTELAKKKKRKRKASNAAPKIAKRARLLAKHICAGGRFLHATVEDDGFICDDCGQDVKLQTQFFTCSKCRDFDLCAKCFPNWTII